METWNNYEAMKIKCRYPSHWEKKDKKSLRSTLGKSVLYHDDILLIRVDIKERVTTKIMYDFIVRIVSFDHDNQFKFSGSDLGKCGKKLRKMIIKSVHDGGLVSIEPVRIGADIPKIKKLKKNTTKKVKIKKIRKIAG